MFHVMLHVSIWYFLVTVRYIFTGCLFYYVIAPCYSNHEVLLIKDRWCFRNCTREHLKKVLLPRDILELSWYLSKAPWVLIMLVKSQFSRFLPLKMHHLAQKILRELVLNSMVWKFISLYVYYLPAENSVPCGCGHACCNRKSKDLFIIMV